MSKSPYFATSSRRQTRSAVKSATQLLSISRLESRKHITIEYEEEGSKTLHSKRNKTVASDAHAQASSSCAVTAGDKSTKKVKRQSKETDAKKARVTWEPANWRRQLANIREMRKGRNAPVDSQGCEKTADPKASPEVNAFAGGLFNLCIFC